MSADVEHPIKSWRARCVIRILLLIAKMVSDDADIQREIGGLHAHISLGIR